MRSIVQSSKSGKCVEHRFNSACGASIIEVSFLYLRLPERGVTASSQVYYVGACIDGEAIEFGKAATPTEPLAIVLGDSESIRTFPLTPAEYSRLRNSFGAREGCRRVEIVEVDPPVAYSSIQVSVFQLKLPLLGGAYAPTQIPLDLKARKTRFAVFQKYCSDGSSCHVRFSHDLDGCC